jgi:DNA-binding SARP family transcriptional activator/tetratricopeptide (TPR) repeat protein
VVLRVAVLGPVAAWYGHEELRVGQPRQQAVLCVLAMRANRVISRAELVAAVWGEDPPASAEGGIYTYVAGLRRVIEPTRSARGPGRVLVSSGAGYVLHLVPGQPDAAAFEQHLAEAGKLRRAGEVTGALGALDRALGLWRGVALAGVPGPFAQTERARLAELRTGAAEDRAEVLLALGRHEEVVPDLTALVADYPLRERLRGLLMTALYRGGRRAEAMRLFTDGQQVLAAELGIGAGAELSRLYQQILTRDPALNRDAGPAADLTGPARAQPGVPGPAQLPRDTPGFTGRRRDLHALRAQLPPVPAQGAAAGAVPVVVISGPPGVGKTALAVHFGHEVAGDFPGGQLFASLRGLDPVVPSVPPGEVLGYFLGALGVSPHRIPAATDERAALFRTVLDGKRVLVVLDNALDAAQVRPLLPGSPGCMAVVTSRSQLSGLAADGATPLPLDVFGDADAREMLARRIGPDRAAAEPRAVTQIAAACAGLPLALSVIAGRAVGSPGRPLAELAAELAGARGRLDALAGQEAAADVRAVLSWSYDQLSPATARVFRLLGLHPGPAASLAAVASLAGIGRGAAATALRELTQANLAVEFRPGRFACHALLRSYAAEAAERTESAAERRAAVHRLLDHYLHTATMASTRFSPHRPPLRLDGPRRGVMPAEFPARDQAVAWFEAEAPVLLTLVEAAAAGGFDVHTWQLPWALAPFFNVRGHWQTSAACQQLALAAARRLGDAAALAHAHYLLGNAQGHLREYDAAGANMRRALELFRELGDRANEGMVLNGLASMLETQGRLTEALEVALDALRMLKAAGHWWTQANLENGVGWLYAHLGQCDLALEHCQQALILHRESGNRAGLADTLDSLGFAYLRLGDLAQARSHYEQAIDVYREISGAFGEGSSLAGLGDVLLALGHPTAARTRYRQATAILDSVSHPLADEVRAKLRALESAEPAPLPTASATER